MTRPLPPLSVRVPPSESPASRLLPSRLPSPVVASPLLPDSPARISGLRKVILVV